MTLPRRHRRHHSLRRFDDEVAVVTGASSGIGRRVAVDLASRGATVIGLARREQLLGSLEAEMLAHSSTSSARVCDLSHVEAFQAVLAEIASSHGRIDLLVNNAGTEQPTPAEAGFSDAYRRIFEVNFFAAVAGTFAVLPGMLARGSGVVVNVSSDNARAPEPRSGAYSASKAALSAFSEAIAHEVAGRGVQVHVLYPAWVATAMGMSGIEEGGNLPPKLVRRTEEQVSAILLDRLGGTRMEINAAALPLLAPIGRTLAPRSYQKAMRQRAKKD
jgi:short-subunit dehydrogenase